MRLQQYESQLADLAITVRHYLISRGADAEVAADVTQDVFVKLLEMELILPADQLRPYMFRVAWTTYLDIFRRQQRYQRLVGLYLRPTQANPGLDGIDENLTRGLARLKATERQLLVLRYVEGLSVQQTAERLQLKLSATKMRLRRVHRKLERLMRSEECE
ncbi:RNA polymerase sigma factor [Levilactobacillus tangyuanensis]|uniref:RNA polymerase sigma factor n=1 Tax=Levilactobacillus tangyuanensis TaxID=2486021 RepID=A0ABW1TNV3_9LACO|nr:RNA polymerase sigma factor [Levilactobacillus tangyuanensis]